MTLAAHSRQSPPSIVPPRWASWPPISGWSSMRKTVRPESAAALAAASPAAPAPTTRRSQRALICGLSAGGRLSGVDSAEAGHGAYRALEGLPPRPEERLVVEPRRQERREPVEERGAIGRRGRRRIDRADGEVVLQRLGRGAKIGRRRAIPRHVDDRVRLLRPCAPDSARAMILEAAADNADAVGEQRGRDAVAFETGVRLAVKSENAGPAAIDPAADG